VWKGISGNGLNKNYKLLLRNFAFEQMGMVCVEFRADNKNEKSVAAMKSIGCTVGGDASRKPKSFWIPARYYCLKYFEG